MGEFHHTIQYGTHCSGRSVSFGVAPPLESDDARKVFEYVRRHVSRVSLAARCVLDPNIPESSEPHTLITLHGFEGRADDVTAAINAKLTALGHTAVVDPQHHILSPDPGIGLFFKAAQGVAPRPE